MYKLTSNFWGENLSEVTDLCISRSPPDFQGKNLSKIAGLRRVCNYVWYAICGWCSGGIAVSGAWLVSEPRRWFPPLQCWPRWRWLLCLCWHNACCARHQKALSWCWQSHGYWSRCQPGVLIASLNTVVALSLMGISTIEPDRKAWSVFDAD